MRVSNFVPLIEVAYGNYHRYLARDLAGADAASRVESDFIPEVETTYNITLQYYDGSGKQIASSRTTPVENYPFKTGQWRISDLYGIYGREVEMLCLLDPHKLHLTEDDYTRLGVNWEGRGDDARRYAE